MSVPGHAAARRQSGLEARFHALFRPHPVALLGQLHSPTYLRWQAALPLL